MLLSAMNQKVTPSVNRTSFRRMRESRNSATDRNDIKSSSLGSKELIAANVQTSRHKSFVAPVSLWTGEGRSM